MECLSFLFVLVTVISRWVTWFSCGAKFLWFTDFVIGGVTFCIFWVYICLPEKKIYFQKIYFVVYCSQNVKALW